MATSGVPRLRIVTALVCALTVVSFVPMVLSHLALIRINREALETAEKKYLSKSAGTLSSNVEIYFKDALTHLKRIADGMRLATAMAPEKDPFIYVGRAGLLADIVGADRNFLVLRTVDRDGVAGVAQWVKIDPHVEQELKQAQAGALRGESVVSDPVHSELFRDGGVVMAVPVVSGEKVLGVVEAVVSLSPIRIWLSDEKKRDVVAYIVDRRGNLVLASDADAVSPKEMRRLELVAEFVTHPVWLTKSYSRGEGRAAHRVLGTVAPLKSPDWGVIVEKDEALAFASVSEMTHASTVAAAFALLLAGIVAVLAARLLSRPVVDLVGKVRLIAEGNFTQRVEPRGTRELVELAETFNSMSDAIEKSVEKLKKAARENQEIFFSSIKALAAAIDAKDPYTRGHSERVARYAVAIAKHLNLSVEEIRKVRIAALLHDVGKIGVDDRILRKPTALTDQEFEVMKTHPVIGALIMGQIPQLRDIIPGMKHHHEKWDGTGYPEGLAKEDIPFLARVITVADTFDAMTTTRPYQKAMKLDYVVSRILSFSGSRFDPVVVAALEKAFATRELEVVGEAARMAVSA